VATQLLLAAFAYGTKQTSLLSAVPTMKKSEHSPLILPSIARVGVVLKYLTETSRSPFPYIQIQNSTNFIMKLASAMKYSKCYDLVLKLV